MIHARDQWAGERGRDMAAECIVVAEQEVPRPPVVVAEGGSDAGAA